MSEKALTHSSYRISFFKKDEILGYWEFCDFKSTADDLHDNMEHLRSLAESDRVRFVEAVPVD